MSWLSILQSIWQAIWYAGVLYVSVGFVVVAVRYHRRGIRSGRFIDYLGDIVWWLPDQWRR